MSKISSIAQIPWCHMDVMVQSFPSTPSKKPLKNEGFKLTLWTPYRFWKTRKNIPS